MLITFEKEGISIGKVGTASIEANVPEPNEPLDLGKAVLYRGKVGMKGASKWPWGRKGNAKLSLDGSTDCKLLLLSADTRDSQQEIIEKYDLGKLITGKQPLLLLEVGVGGDVSGAGSFRYGLLEAGVSLKAGVEGGAAWARPIDLNENAKNVVLDFGEKVKLPAAMNSAPEKGDVTVFEYNGDLQLGASVSAGFEVDRATTADIGALKLLESFKGDISARLSLKATVSGSFRVTIREAQNKDGSPLPGWASVVVSRTRKNALTAAAGLTAKAALMSDGLPTDPKEFFGTLLGVEAGNWINWANDVVKEMAAVTSVDALKARIDALGGHFLDEWLGSRLPGLIGPEGEAFMKEISTAAEKYNEAGEDVRALLDAYIDKGEDTIEGFLKDLENATSWDEFKGDVNSEVWDLVNRVTGGDPLDWLIRKIPDGKGGHLPSLDDLKKLADETAGKAKTLLDSELRGLLEKAKKEFGFLDLMSKATAKLATIHSPADLVNLAGTKAGSFLARVVGKELDKIPKGERQEVFDALKKVSANWESESKEIGGYLEKAAKLDFEADLSAAYSLTDEKDALLDVAICMESQDGKDLFRSAVSGDFSEVFDKFSRKPGLCQINGGTFTHKLVKKRTLKAAFFGWRDGFKYQDVTQVIVNCKQKIQPGEGGTLIVNSAFTGEFKEDEKRESERHAKFTLALAAIERMGQGEDSGFDDRTQSFLVRTVEAKSASYSLREDDPKTSKDELKEYLAFAETVGLGKVDDLFRTLEATISPKNGGFGAVKVDYKVKFSEGALGRIFGRLPVANKVKDDFHKILGPIVLGPYVHKVSHRNIGWAFYTGFLKKECRDAGNLLNFLGSEIHFQPPPKPEGSLFAPPPVGTTFENAQIMLLQTLYYSEERVRKAWTALFSVLGATKAKTPKEVEKALNRFFSAAKEFKEFSMEKNFLFVFFDRLSKFPELSDVPYVSSLVVSFSDSKGVPRKVTFVQPGK